MAKKKQTPAQKMASEGGKARAKALSPEQRSEIARKAVEARWQKAGRSPKQMPRATHDGEIVLGDGKIRMACAVLPNGKRLLTQGGFLLAIGRSRTPKAGTGALTTVDGLPTFLQAEALKLFISNDLRESTTPIFFLDKSGRRSVGYDAELLPGVAEVYLNYRDWIYAQDRRVPRQYQRIVETCDIVMRGLARVGIIALVDEATGYQDDRDRDALAKILEAFVAKELKKWIRTFEPDFYKELFRLRGLPYNGTCKKPSYIGHLTNDLVYSRLAPGVLQELRKKNPKQASGNRKAKHHQWLTEDFGHKKLENHLTAVTALMRGHDSWKPFHDMLEKSLPKYTPMPLWEDQGVSVD